MSKRKIIKIEEDKCNGCGLCIPNCPEGAIQIIDGKARLISDLFCDGLGACLGHCPEGAIIIEEREAEKYSERKVMENIVKQGANVIKAHLNHLKEHNEQGYLHEALSYLKEKGINNPIDAQAGIGAHQHISGGCPGSKIMDLKHKQTTTNKEVSANRESELVNWPVQIMLVPAFAPFLNNADLLIAADCVAFAYPSFHEDLLKGKVLLVGCPKLDNIDIYKQKIKQIIENNNLKSMTYVHIEVPCCSGLLGVVEEAIAGSGKKIPFQEVIIGIKGERLK
ncbi:MAG: 4Fe-4S binding protein [Candidatus Omnitrophica bacterium]|nr:4Fe-4S binding protein [Candidatus Omnitrophota bacterium]